MNKEVIDVVRDEISEQIPDWWALCSNGQCPRCATCLRHKAWLDLTGQTDRWLCLLPSAWSDGDCRKYVSIKKQRMARGFSLLMQRLHDREHRYQIRMAITDYLGSKGTYYRYKDGERLLSPEQQRWIEDLFAHYGYTQDIDFDSYEEGYDFDAS